MELKYPKIASGLRLIYISWWFSFIGGIASMFVKIGSMVEVSLELLSLASGVLELVVYVIYAIGIYRAGKEEKRYQKILFLTIAETVLGFFFVIIAVFFRNWLLELLVFLAVIFVLVSRFLRICWLVKITEELVGKEGDAGVAGYYTFIFWGYIAIYGSVIAGAVIVCFTTIALLGGILIMLAMLAALMVVTVYAIFLHNTSKFFNGLEKPQSMNAWENFNAEQINKLFGTNTMTEE